MRLHRVIYNVIEEIESAMKGMLDPEYEEQVIGQAEVRPKHLKCLKLVLSQVVML
ncbi:translation initiation factor IF-2 [Staphylococcus gallinarum]|uniref:Translation initiation factor IF-2 n=1 Tax=Staphylococcus gallinarum TaxID=1293 RepID=A0A380FHU7_STAGA|nr:translation initiation factor IF-2 [Staphylococcus gallinarum]